MKILVLHKGGIGDVVFVLPLLDDLKRAYPGSELTVLTHDQGRELLAFAPAVDRALALGPVSTRWKLKEARALLKGERFDLALTTARSPRAAYLLWRVAKVRVGFAGGPEALLYTHRAPSQPVEVEFSRRFERLGIALGVSVSGALPRLSVPPFAQSRARALLLSAGWSGKGFLIAAHVGGGWPTKQWPIEYIASLAKLLQERWGATLLLQGGKGDVERAERVEELASGSVIAAVGNPMQDALAQAALCDAAVGLDSGLSHATAALGVPTLHLFGPNDPQSIRWAPHQTAITVGLECQPCNRAGKAGCPLGHHRCMRDITPAYVAAALEPLLARRAAR